MPDNDKKMTAIEKAQQKMREMRERGEKPKILDPIEKARQNPKSFRLAINAKCWDCVGAGADPHPRRTIRDCPTGKYCPLFPLRPYQEAK